VRGNRPPDQRPCIPADGRQAFIEHARYYLEVLRIHASIETVGAMVSVEEWEHWEPLFRQGRDRHAPPRQSRATAASLRRRGLHAVVPIEEIRPRALFEPPDASPRSGRGATLVPLAKARRPMIEALRRGDLVGVLADRDLSGTGHRTLFFGLPAMLPTGPASLAILSGRPLVAAAAWRVGRERFNARAWLVEATLSGDRGADVAALTEAVARRMEEAISVAPEQWFGCFQPIWAEEGSPRG
jgi:hypothetical protein